MSKTGSLSQEIWANIKDYENYQVSNFGRVKSFAWGREVILKLYLLRSGYEFVVLYNKKDKRKNKTIHRLVAEAFVENKNNKKQVNHIDGVKTNNYATNLEWCNNGENQKHAYENNLKPNNKPVNQYSLQGKYIKTFSSANDAGEILDIYQQNISKACNNQYKSAGGFLWRFYDGNTHDIYQYKAKTQNKSKKVLRTNKEDMTTEEFVSIKEASRKTDVSSASISLYCNKKREDKNYYWSFIE